MRGALSHTASRRATPGSGTRGVRLSIAYRRTRPRRERRDHGADGTCTGWESMAMAPSREAGREPDAGAGSVVLVVTAGRVSDCRQRASEASAVTRVRRGRRTAAPAVAVAASLSGSAAIPAWRAPAVVASFG